MDNNDAKFLIVKDNKTKQIKYFDYDKIDGYKLSAKKNYNFFDDIYSSYFIQHKKEVVRRILEIVLKKMLNI